MEDPGWLTASESRTVGDDGRSRPAGPMHAYKTNHPTTACGADITAFVLWGHTGRRWTRGIENGCPGCHAVADLG